MMNGKNNKNKVPREGKYVSKKTLFKANDGGYLGFVTAVLKGRTKFKNKVKRRFLEEIYKCVDHEMDDFLAHGASFLIKIDINTHKFATTEHRGLVAYTLAVGGPSDRNLALTGLAIALNEVEADFFSPLDRFLNPNPLFRDFSSLTALIDIKKMV
jgi:hypothetical protein